MRKFYSLSTTVILVIVLSLTADVFAPPATRQTTQTTRRTLSPQEKRQQLQQESSSAMTEIDTTYREILANVNSAQNPSEEALENALKVIARNRKYLPFLTDTQKSIYHILSAWVYYFDNKPDRAIKQAISAQKAAPKNPNTTRTRLALSMIYKDYPSAAIALSEQSNNSRSRPQQTGSEEQISYSVADSEIQLDINTVSIDLLGKTFDFHPQALKESDKTGTVWSFNKLNCALLWQIDVNELKNFAPQQATQTPAGEVQATTTDTGMDEFSESPQETAPPAAEYQEYQPATQISEFESFAKLMSQFSANLKIAFSGINLNDPNKKENVINWLSKNPQNWQTFTLPLEEQQRMFAYLNDGLNKPILLIVAPDNTIRYAGNVEGFLPQMVINSILKNPQEFAEPNDPNRPASVSETTGAVPSGTYSTDANKPANSDVSGTQPAKQVPTAPDTAVQPQRAERQTDDDYFSAVSSYEAEKLLSNARTLMQIGSRLPSHMYREPVELCRRIIREYPDTDYAHEAQMLLRNVPDEYRQQYNITDEELGL